VQSGGKRTVQEKRDLYKRQRQEIADLKNAAPLQRIELTREEMVRKKKFCGGCEREAYF
jgi:hypothetical protein